MLKASWVRVGRRCAVGAGSVVLYDTEMEDGSRLDALSLLMKGETLPAGTAWAGIPASRRERDRVGREATPRVPGGVGRVPTERSEDHERSTESAA